MSTSAALKRFIQVLHLGMTLNIHKLLFFYIKIFLMLKKYALFSDPV